MYEAVQSIEDNAQERRGVSNVESPGDFAGVEER
jgi:hypothetical protein